MPKARIIKFGAGACAFVSLLWVVPGAAQSPPVIGKLIEQAKKNKLNELGPPPPVAEPLPGLAPTKALPPPLAPTPEWPPALWSLSGVNQRLTAEILIDEQIHRVKVARGVALPGGWTVMAGDVSSLTLSQGQKVLTLFPSDPGSTGAEYPGLKKGPKLVSSSFDAFQEVLNSRGIPVEYAKVEPAQAGPAPNVEQARQAARSLPIKP